MKILKTYIKSIGLTLVFFVCLLAILVFVGIVLFGIPSLIYYGAIYFGYAEWVGMVGIGIYTLLLMGIVMYPEAERL